MAGKYNADFLCAREGVVQVDCLAARIREYSIDAFIFEALDYDVCALHKVGFLFGR